MRVETCEGCGRQRDDPTKPPLLERAGRAVVEAYKPTSVTKPSHVPGGFRFTFTATEEPAAATREKLEEALRPLGLTEGGITFRGKAPVVRIAITVERRPALVHPQRGPTLRFDIGACPRCGGAHAGVDFHGLLPAKTRTVFTHWAVCPESADPILAVVEHDRLDEAA